MGMLDDALGSSSNPAIPGGDLSKPLIAARATCCTLHERGAKRDSFFGGR